VFECVDREKECVSRAVCAVITSCAVVGVVEAYLELQAAAGGGWQWHTQGGLY